MLQENGLHNFWSNNNYCDDIKPNCDVQQEFFKGLCIIKKLYKQMENDDEKYFDCYVCEGMNIYEHCEQ